MSLKPIGELFPEILRKASLAKISPVLRANEARLAGTATAEQIALLNAIRLKHGAGPLPSESERGTGIGSMKTTTGRAA